MPRHRRRVVVQADVVRGHRGVPEAHLVHVPVVLQTAARAAATEVQTAGERVHVRGAVPVVSRFVHVHEGMGVFA